MIREFLLMAALTAEPEAAQPPDDTSIETQRATFDTLSARAIGTASRPVRFDWRNSTIGFGVTSAALLELNNFASARVGGFARFPVGGNFQVEVAVTRVFTWGSQSSDQLSLTPYRQYARPSRVELDFNVHYALFEGVATARPGFIPASEFVFSVSAGLRYLLYPGSMGNMTASQVAVAIFAPRLNDQEELNMRSQLLPAMALDRNRYQIVVGLNLDVYFQPGFFVTPRVMLGIPLTSGFGSGGIGAFWELSLLAGYAL